MFVDHAKIYVKAGDGGNGCVAFRREKYVPRGGPSGGDGGDGGDIFIRTTNHLNTLLPFRYKQHFKSGRGGHGSGNRRHGRNGRDTLLEVPLGTQVYDAETGALLVDLDETDRTFLLAKGGRGGRGNAAFATATNQAPRQSEPGAPGEEKTLILELKVLADVGLVGLPNAGKSTLIAAISAARPKIADYPFTTLTPNLGVVYVDEFLSFVVADIPGLIEGAHSGSGLGDRFLRHVERTRVLLHLVDVSGSGETDPVQAIETVSRELELYSSELTRKPQLLVASKLDAADESRLQALRRFCCKQGLPLLEVSAVSGTGLKELKGEIARLLGVKVT